MGILKERSNKNLIAGLAKFEDSKNAVKKSDYSDLKAFVTDFLNTPDKRQRKKISEEFKKRNLELYEFLQSNSELIAAETEISKTVSNVLHGDTSSSDNERLSNLFEIIEEELK